MTVILDCMTQAYIHHATCEYVILFANTFLYPVTLFVVTLYKSHGPFKESYGQKVLRSTEVLVAGIKCGI